MSEIRINAPLSEDIVMKLRIGDNVLLSGTIYTGRDAAHKRLIDLIHEGKPLPFNLTNEVIYYVGPAPAKPGYSVGSAGPTSSYRMDTYATILMDYGLRGMIGKGKRSPACIESMVKNKAVYLGAIGGAAALISKRIVSSEVIAFDDLGPEAIHKYVVKDMPLIVLIDALGNNLFETETAKYRIEE